MDELTEHEVPGVRHEPSLVSSVAQHSHSDYGAPAPPAPGFGSALPVTNCSHYYLLGMVSALQGSLSDSLAASALLPRLLQYPVGLLLGQGCSF